MSRRSQIEFLSRFAGAYDSVVQLLGFESLWQAVADVAAPRAGERSLDVCTGTGGVALELARRGAEVFGIDLASGMLRHAVRKREDADARNAHFVRMNARHLAFSDGTFPLVTVSMALHEMAEPERVAVLGEVRRVASERVVVAEYRVPRARASAWIFRAKHCFEYLESDDFERFMQHDVKDRLTSVGLIPDGRLDVGSYRIWACRVDDGAPS